MLKLTGINVYSIGYFNYKGQVALKSNSSLDFISEDRAVYVPGGEIKKGPAIAVKCYNCDGTTGHIKTGEPARIEWSGLLARLGIESDNDLKMVGHAIITFDILKACNWNGKVDGLPKELTALLKK